MVPTDRLSTAFVAVAGALAAGCDLEKFLDVVLGHAVEVCRAGAAGIALHDGAEWHVAASSQAGRELELLQVSAADGPGPECLRTVRAVDADLEDAPERWPRFVVAARAAGFGSVHSVPMRVDDEVIGTLGLYGARGHPIGAPEKVIGQSLADVAAIAVVQQRTLARADLLAEQLQRAMDSRVVLEQAKGATARAQSISPDEAFQRMRREARSSRRRVADVAADVVDRLHPDHRRSRREGETP